MLRRDTHLRKLGRVVQRIYEEDMGRRIEVPTPEHWASKRKSKRNSREYIQNLKKQLNSLSMDLNKSLARIEQNYEKELNKISNNWPPITRYSLLLGYFAVVLHEARVIGSEDALKLAYASGAVGIGHWGGNIVYEWLRKVKRKRDEENIFRGIAENAARLVLSQIPREKITPKLLRDIHTLLVEHAERGHGERIVADTFARVILEDLDLHPKYRKFLR